MATIEGVVHAGAYDDEGRVEGEYPEQLEGVSLGWLIGHRVRITIEDLGDAETAPPRPGAAGQQEG